MLLSDLMVTGDQIHILLWLRGSTGDLGGSHAATREGSQSVIHDQVTVRPGLPGRVLCVGIFINGAPFVLESVLFWKIN